MDLSRVLTWLKSRLNAAGRMGAWLGITLGLSLLIAMLAPQQIGVTLYKLSLLTAAAWVGYWIDRGLFPYARPHMLLSGADHLQAARFAAAMIRRALIVAAAMLAMGLAA